MEGDSFGIVCYAVCCRNRQPFNRVIKNRPHIAVKQ